MTFRNGHVDSMSDWLSEDNSSKNPFKMCCSHIYEGNATVFVHTNQVSDLSLMMAVITPCLGEISQVHAYKHCMMS